MAMNHKKKKENIEKCYLHKLIIFFLYILRIFIVIVLLTSHWGQFSKLFIFFPNFPYFLLLLFFWDRIKLQPWKMKITRSFCFILYLIKNFLNKFLQIKVNNKYLSGTYRGNIIWKCTGIVHKKFGRHSYKNVSN